MIKIINNKIPPIIITIFLSFEGKIFPLFMKAYCFYPAQKILEPLE